MVLVVLYEEGWWMPGGAQLTGSIYSPNLHTICHSQKEVRGREGGLSLLAGGTL